jgi:signal transduction histidine kinase/CheY-like chemotaxis protein
MRRLLKLRTWGLRGTTAAETSLVLVAATLLVPLLLFIGAAWITYDDSQRQAEERLARTLDLLYVNARATFETQALVVSNVREIVDGYSSDEILADGQRIRERLERLVRAMPQVEDVFVLDHEGRPLVSASTFPMPAGISGADRPYFTAHRDDKQPRFISEIFRSRLKGVDIFQYSERREKKDGTFDGVVIASIPPSYFVSQFGQASDAKQYVASIVRTDGEVLARFPEAPGRPTRLDPNSGFMRAIAVNPDVGRYVTESSGFDGVARVFMYRRLADLPIYVALGFSLESIRATWIDRMASHLVFGIPATIALFMLALVASRRAMRQDEAYARLREEQGRRESAEEGLRQSQKMTAVGQLTAGIAHDFNNLLTGIGGAIEMIGRRVPQPTPEVTRFLDLAKTGVSRAALLTQRMLAFARQQPLQIEPLDINKLVAGMSEMLRRTLGEKVRIETVLAGGLWRAEADAAQLESAILNLAINGRDAMPGGGTLTIETANAHLDDAYAAANIEVKAGQYVMIAVSDTGTGMDRDTLARAFEPFFTTKERGQGTGLGLSMTFGYVKQIGGHLQIYSEPGSGTVAKVYLPRTAGEATPDLEPAVQPASAAGTGPVVLVVEDDPMVREFAVSACREIGCTVYQAGDGEEALRLLAAHDDIVLLFTDVGLPRGMNGRQLAAIATERRPRLKVLFTTGYTANAIVHHGVLDAGVHFIGKPFSITALAAKIKSLGF